MFDKRQLDCVDSSRNTTSLLLILVQLNLLRYHDVVEPVARGHIFDLRPPHVTAVLRERKTGEEWSVDSWTRAYGQAPEIMPLERWKTRDSRRRPPDMKTPAAGAGVYPDRCNQALA
jgi:hypothetical protein